MTKLPFPQSLSDKYRPAKMTEFIGLDKVKRVLSNFAERPFASSWLFLGPSGTGKTSMALALAAELPAELHHIPSREADLESVQNLAHVCAYVPMGAPWHLALFDEADQMTPAAQLALLSKMDATGTLPGTVLIFTANDTRLLEPRFLSRCHLLEFTPESTASALPRYLQKIARAEGFRYPDSLPDIAKLSGSNVRDALMRLEVELLTGTRRGLPDAPKPDAEHAHEHRCPACKAPWQCSEPDCALAWRSTCSRCGGAAKTIYQVRAAKAVATRIENIRRMIPRRARRQS